MIAPWIEFISQIMNFFVHYVDTDKSAF